MVSNLDDLKIWAEALGTGTLISEALHQEQLKFHPIALAGVPDFYAAMDPGYGLALERYNTYDPLIGHSGHTNAYNAQMYSLQSQGTIVITLTNTDTVSGDGPLFFATVAKIAIPGTFPNVATSSDELPEIDREQDRLAPAPQAQGYPDQEQAGRQIAETGEDQQGQEPATRNLQHPLP